MKLSKKGEWLRDIGFNYVEGNEHSFYAGKPRFAFRSASDEALYARANQWRATEPAPYLLVLETVSTHQPYTDPQTGKHSLELAMKYADQAFGNFLLELRQSGYFSNGILVVVSDHRSMTPIPAKEFEVFGSDSHSLVPAFIVGTGFNAGDVDDRVYSQADFVPSFELWLSGTTQLSALEAVMFGGSSRPQGTAASSCAFHSRGDQRGLVDAICNGGRGEVRLDGDQTRFTQSEGLAAADREGLLNDLAVLRLEGLQRHELRQAALTKGRAGRLMACNNHCWLW